MYEDKIPYDKPEKWDEYLEKLLDLHSVVKGLMEHYRQLKEELVDKPLKQVVKTHRTIIFGGFYADKETPYSEEALARFYRDIAGIGITDEEAKQIASRIREGAQLEDAVEGVKIKANETNVMGLVKQMEDLLDNIVDSIDIVEQLGVEEKEPRNYGEPSSTGLVNAFKDLLYYSRRILPLYEPLSFFIQSLYSIPRFYLNHVYKNIYDPQVRNMLKDKIGLEELVTILEPDIPQPLRNERAIIGLEPGTPPHQILELIYTIYKLFRCKELKKFYNIDDEFTKYVNTYKDRLERATRKYSKMLNVIYRYSSVYCRRSKEPFILSIDGECCYLETKGACLVLIKEAAKYVYTSSENGEDLQYRDFVTVMAPAMFVGLAQVRGVSTGLGTHLFGWIPWTR